MAASCAQQAGSKGLGELQAAVGLRDAVGSVQIPPAPARRGWGAGAVIFTPFGCVGWAELFLMTGPWLARAHTDTPTRRAATTRKRMGRPFPNACTRLATPAVTVTMRCVWRAEGSIKKRDLHIATPLVLQACAVFGLGTTDRDEGSFQTQKGISRSAPPCKGVARMEHVNAGRSSDERFTFRSLLCCCWHGRTPMPCVECTQNRLEKGMRTVPGFSG